LGPEIPAGTVGIDGFFPVFGDIGERLNQAYFDEGRLVKHLMLQKSRARQQICFSGMYSLVGAAAY